MRNNILHKLKTVLIIAVLLPAFFACSDSLLDLQPKGKWHHGNIADSLLTVDSEVLAEAKVLDNYAHLRGWGFSWAYMAMSSIASDDADKGSSPADGGVDMQAMENYSFNSSNSLVRDTYNTLFQGVVTANEALVLLSSMEEGPKRDQLVAEAQFLRALYYFRLVRCYGGVSKITSVLAEDAAVPARATTEEIYQLIETDLKDAIAKLPTKSDYLANGGLGRATRGAAQGYLAKVYLYQKKWADVLSMTEAVLSNSSYDLSTPIDKIFTEAQENGKESLFEVQADITDVLDAGSQYGQIQGIRGTPNYGWGFNNPSQKLVDAFESGDPRKLTTVIISGTVMPDGLDLGAGYTQVNPYYNMKTYHWLSEREDKGRNGDQGKWINDRLLRTADVVLMHAEAANELGNTTEALDKLEMVRARARNGNSSVLPRVTTTNQSELRAAIQHERRVELAMEHERYFDLIRWGLAEKELGSLGWVAGKHEVYPIPQEEIDKSEGSLVQNPGY